MKYFKLPPEMSPDEKIEELFTEIGKVCHVGCHDGNLNLESELWDQPWEPMQDLWSRLTVPSNVKALKRRIGTAKNPDWERLIQAAYRKSLERSQFFK